MASENTLDPAPGGRESASGNTAGRRGARPTALPDQYAQVAAGYAGALARAPLADHNRRTYLSRARMFLAWLHADDGAQLDLATALDGIVAAYTRTAPSTTAS